MNEKEFNGLILAELVKIANDVFTNEIEIAPGTYTAAELAKLKDANGNEINIKYLCVDAKLNITDFRTVQINRALSAPFQWIRFLILFGNLKS